MSATTLLQTRPPIKPDILVTAMHNIQQRQRSEAYIRVHMVSDDTKGIRITPDIEACCKTDTDAVQMLCQFLLSMSHVQQCLTPLRKL